MYENRFRSDGCKPFTFAQLSSTSFHEIAFIAGFLGNPVEGERDSGLKLNPIPL